MNEAQNTKVVQDAYAAFGRGDIATLLSYMTEDVQWEPVIGTAAHVPFSGARTGKAQVAEFFKQVAAAEDFQQFEPREFVAQDEQVVAIGHRAAVVWSMVVPSERRTNARHCVCNPGPFSVFMSDRTSRRSEQVR